METPRFEQLFDRHFEDIYGYVAFRIAPDIDGARDVTHEVFTAALESFSTLRQNNSAGAWLRGIARHKVADYFRHRQAAPTSVGDAINEIRSHRDGPVSPAESAAVQVSIALRRLQRRDADLLEEKYLEGRSVREMAESRGTTEKAVESALSRAREAFRAAMSEVQTKEGYPNDQEPG
jgi:RNA polymerase sigma-70 factor (ECF subfamily)